MNADNIPILICIVSTNDGHWLEACLQSLVSAQNLAKVMVVINDCSDESENICRQSGLDVSLIHTDSRMGFAECNNLCLRQALKENFEYVFLLNPDTKIHLQTLETLLNFLRSNNEFAVAGSLQIEYGDDSWSKLNEWSNVTIEHAISLGRYKEELNGFTWIEHNYVQGAAMMFPVKLIQEIGLLDPVYRTFYEETDFCRRTQLLGRKVAILFNSMVQHYGGGNWKADLKRHYERDRLFLRNQFLYFISGAESYSLMPFIALSLVYKQIKMILLKQENIILPLWQYPFALLSAISRLNAILRLYHRNRIIRAGKFIPNNLWEI